MNIQAIVYTSNAGHTQQYAIMLGDRLSCPVYALKDAEKQLPRGADILYLGWLYASHVKGYPRAAKRFSVRAVCAVGLCDTGTLTNEVRKATAIPSEIPLFTLQGGLDRTRLRGVNRLMIAMLTKGLSAQTQRSAQDERMLTLLTQDASYVSEENLRDVLALLERAGGENG